MNHIDDRHTLSNRTNHTDSRVNRFEDCVGSEWRWDENHRSVCTRLLDRFLDGIKNREPLDCFAGLTWRYATNHLGAILFATFGMERSGFTGDSLADDSRFAIYKNTHNLLILGSLDFGFCDLKK